MAKQTGPVKLEGTIGNICFYKMGEAYYARLKSSLTGKRVKKDPRFRRTMEFASCLAVAAKIAAEIYSTLPKQRGLYRKIVGMAMQLLKLGMEREEAVLQLKEILAAALLKETLVQLAEPGSAEFHGVAGEICRHSQQYDLCENKPRPKPYCRKKHFTRPLFSCITYQNRNEHRKRMPQRKESSARIRGDTSDVVM